MPISEDSTSVIVRRGPMTRASAAAVIQPAVPPPAITTDLISRLVTAQLAFSERNTRRHRVPAGVKAPLRSERID